jgi:cell division protein FtsI (penicillin-binding protein 3)
MNSAEKKNIQRRTLFVGVFFGLSIAIIGAKVVYLQVFCGPWLSQKAADQYERAVTSNGKRGTIYDSKHREMAVSIDVTSIAAYPHRIENAPLNALAKTLDIDSRKLRRKLESQKSFVWVKRKVTPKEAQAVRDLQLRGIDFIPERSRFYPNKTLAAQVLGFAGLDGHGLEGIEYYYDDFLKGPAEQFTIFKDALGRGFDAENQMAFHNSGKNLILTIDGTVQYITEKALKEAVEKFSAKSGMALVMAPKTGAILAMAHFPFFNPNAFGDFDRQLWRNRALTDPFEPGSTLKIFSAAAALESGICSPHSIFFCENGKYKIGKDVVHDTHPHGWLSLQQIIKYSSNIGTVKVSEAIGAELLHNTLRSFGFGQKTGLDCPGETAGSLSPYKRWSKIDAAAISFGQGISVSAIQLITAAAAIANDGILMKPRIVHAITDQHGAFIKRFAPQRIRRVIAAKTAGTLRRIMQSVTTKGGTGVNAALEGYSVCGKTGTAQKTDEKGTYAKGKYIASFIGFVPTNKPKAVILVIVDEPQKKHYGGTVAAPAFRTIALKTIDYLNIPSKTGLDRLRVVWENRDRG